MVGVVCVGLVVVVVELWVCWEWLYYLVNYVLEYYGDWVDFIDDFGIDLFGLV